MAQEQEFQIERKKTSHLPRLDTVLMVEDTVRKHSGEYGRFQIWRKLPKSVMYQTFLKILDYLEYSNKIAYDKEGKVGWIFSPGIYKKYSNRKNLRR
jgi:hypothetical protein